VQRHIGNCDQLYASEPWLWQDAWKHAGVEVDDASCCCMRTDVAVLVMMMAATICCSLLRSLTVGMVCLCVADCSGCLPAHHVDGGAVPQSYVCQGL
jgi:hypothetical protein